MKKQLKDAEGWEKEFDYITPNKYGIVTSRPIWIKDLNEEQKRTLFCFNCGEKFDTAIEMGYWKYETGQKICRYCEPKMLEKRLALRDRLVKAFIRTLLAKERKKAYKTGKTEGLAKFFKQHGIPTLAKAYRKVGKKLLEGEVDDQDEEIDNWYPRPNGEEFID